MVMKTAENRRQLHEAAGKVVVGVELGVAVGMGTAVGVVVGVEVEVGVDRCFLWDVGVEAKWVGRTTMGMDNMVT